MWLLWAGSLGVLLISLWNTRLNLFPLFQGAVPGIVLGIISWITREAVGYGDVWIITLWGFISESGIPSPWYALRSFSAVLPQWDVWFGKIPEGYEDSVCSFSYSSICGGGFFMRMKASATIEAAVACSVFFLSFFFSYQRSVLLS